MAFDNIKLEKGLYTTGKSFTQALEELDSSENYKGTELEGLDAYQRQLKRFGIKVSGPQSDTVSKFFKTTDSAVLFPEYISRAVRSGIEQNNVVDKIVATTTEIDAFDYRSLKIATPDEEVQLADVAEGAYIPETVISTSDELTTLKKRGRTLVASYEAIKFQKLDLFTIMLKKIGESISKSQLADAVEALVQGECSYATRVDPEEITYADLMALWETFSGAQLTSILCTPQDAAKILQISQFIDSAAGLNFHATGELITPLGAELVKCDGVDLSGAIIGLDKNYALEKVQAGGVITDFDKLIDRQLERAVISTIAGFSRLMPNTVGVLS